MVNIALLSGTIAGVVLAIIRLIESINQLATQPDVQGVIGKVWQVILNFLTDIEQYKKK
jgi:hypothetical protein